MYECSKKKVQWGTKTGGWSKKALFFLFLLIHSLGFIASGGGHNNHINRGQVLLVLLKKTKQGGESML
jgi:hypothetical protein